MASLRGLLCRFALLPMEVFTFSPPFSHEELLSKGEVYAGMWQQQLMKADDSSAEDTDGATSSTAEDFKTKPNENGKKEQ